MHSAGRRRIGDLQYFIDNLATQRTGYVVHVVSLDIVVDTTWGDATNPATRNFWIDAIRRGFVLAFVGGHLVNLGHVPAAKSSKTRRHAKDRESSEMQSSSGGLMTRLCERCTS